MAVRVVVDSTADIPRERAQPLGIEIVPQTVLFGDEAFLDGIDLDGPAFYRKLVGSRIMPTTAAPSPGLLEETYRRVIAEDATAIISLHEAAALSSTVSNARTAAEIVTRQTGVPIAVIDSGTVSVGFGLPAELLAQRARADSDVDAVRAYAEDLCERMRLFAVLDTLEYLQRGGRIGPARALLGSVLKMKPLLTVRDGQVLPVENVRTRAKALERLGQLVAALGELEAVAVVESDPEAGAPMLAVARQFWAGPIEQFPLGPVVGAHAGPGAAGIAAIVKAPPHTGSAA
jgi:DegV family protein with EDD domain